MASKQDESERSKHPNGGGLPSESALTPSVKIEQLAYAARPDHPIRTECFGALSRTMLNNGDAKQRRLVEFKQGCRYGQFGKTKAYELIAQQRIRAYKMGGKTMIDLDSVDEFHASLPRVESRAS